MENQWHVQNRLSSQSPPNQVTNPFAPRPFGIQTQVDQPLSQPELSEAIASDVESAEVKPLGGKISDIPAYPPDRLPPTPIQTQLSDRRLGNFPYSSPDSANYIQLQPQFYRAGITDTSLQLKESEDDSKDHSEFDSNQFRISGKAPDRKIELVSRQEIEGKVVYFAKGIVKGFEGNDPKIELYETPVPLGDWYPSVTHINGMNVTPKAGLKSAEALQESINDALGGKEEAALERDAIDVLYTYSAQRGGKAADIFDCIKGKVGVRDQATENQENIMYDAVKSQHRVTVSAHSRGTIKTDNAVRNVHQKLADEYYVSIKDKKYEALLKQYQNGFGLQLSGMPTEVLAETIIRKEAEQTAQDDMNKYIQLIYAGNAVSFPSSILKVKMPVAGLDPISLLFGTYSSPGQKLYSMFGGGGGEGSEVTNPGWTKGHSFNDNYLPDVSKLIANDLKNRSKNPK